MLPEYLRVPFNPAEHDIFTARVHAGKSTGSWPSGGFVAELSQGRYFRRAPFAVHDFVLLSALKRP
jgi:hypothetical protein